MVQFPSLFAGAASRNARFRNRRLPATLAIGLALVLIPAAAAQAAVFFVTTTADGNNGGCTVSLCTLRDAVIANNAVLGTNIITLPAGLYNLTIAGANEDNAATGDLDIKAGSDLTINGAGAATTIIDGGALDRVFQVLGNATLFAVNDVTIRNGMVTGSGGGILSSSTDSLRLTNCVVTGNKSSGQGGGIFSSRVTLVGTTVSGNQSTGDQAGGIFLFNLSSTITNSTISGNSSQQEGAGFYLNGSTNANSPALLTINNSTISGNTITGAGSSGGGMFLLSQATVTIVSSTIASNSAPSSGGNIQNGAALTLKNTIVSNPVSGTNCSGTAITDGGGNLQFPGTTCGATITVGDPLLQALAANGGPTQTRALSTGSPALNAASGCPPPATDQRGIARPQGSACEIGAFECQTGECGGVAPTLTPTNTPAGVATATPTNTPGVTATPTRTTTPIGVVVPTLTFPMLALLGLALAGAALLLLKR
jgi:CSLREA domain-containing protein